MKHGRTALTVGVEGMHPAKVFLPFHFAPEIEAIEAARTEECVKAFAVGDGRVGSQAAGGVSTFVRELFAQDFLPEHLSVPAAEGKDKLTYARLLAAEEVLPAKKAQLRKLHEQLNPFALAREVERQKKRIDSQRLRRN